MNPSLFHRIQKQRFRRITALIVTSVMLVFLAVVPVVPAAAQAPIPTPVTLSQAAQDVTTVTQTVTSSAQQLGTAALIAIMATVVLALIVVFFLVVVILLGRPFATQITNLLNTVTSLTAALSAEREERGLITQKLTGTLQDQAAAQKDAAEQRARTTEAQERLANAISTFETQVQAEQGRKDTIAAINTHTTEQLDNAVKSLNTARDEIKTAAQTIQNTPTAPTIDQIRAIVEESSQRLETTLNELIQQLIAAKKKGDTGRLNPAVVPETPPDAKPVSNPN